MQIIDRFDWELFRRAVRMLLKGRWWNLIVGALVVGFIFRAAFSTVESVFLSLLLWGGNYMSDSSAGNLGCVVWTWFVMNGAYEEKRFGWLPNFGRKLTSELRLAVPAAAFAGCVGACLICILWFVGMLFLSLLMAGLGGGSAWLLGSDLGGWGGFGILTAVVVFLVTSAIAVVGLVVGLGLPLLLFEFLHVCKGWDWKKIVAVTAPCFMAKDLFWRFFQEGFGQTLANLVPPDWPLVHGPLGLHWGFLYDCLILGIVWVFVRWRVGMEEFDKSQGHIKVSK
ncbi:MAG: hypothetical protein K1X53_16555 [Candidatus Sumerlaeaceae bacterium]|nr:hypothetical protein [Candidatus Sumerlaeaceae bacterium]